MSLYQRLTAHLHTVKAPPYVINLDPAVHEVPFPANIGEGPAYVGRGHNVVNVEVSVCVTPLAVSPADIRDTVNYKEVMKQYGLGPNGGIVTSLNLFATRFDQVTCSDSAFCVNSDLTGSSINQLTASEFLCGSVSSHW